MSATKSKTRTRRTSVRRSRAARTSGCGSSKRTVRRRHDRRARTHEWSGLAAHRRLSANATPAYLRYASPAGRWALLATVLGSSLASLDATVVNIALPRIGQEFGAGLS